MAKTRKLITEKQEIRKKGKELKRKKTEIEQEIKNMNRAGNKKQK